MSSLSTITDTPFDDSYEGTRYQRYRDEIYDFLSKRWIMIALTVFPPLGLFIVINVIPIIWAVAAGFHEISAFRPAWTFTGLENFKTTLNDSKFWRTIRRSLIFAAGSTSIQIVAGTGFALLINREFKFNKLVRSIALLPYLIPTAILGFLALWMGNSQFGVINDILMQLNFIQSPVPWYGSPDLAMISLILTNSWKLAIFTTLLVLARLQSIPDDFYEAAEMCGASVYQQFRDITLPNLKGVIFIVLLLRSVWMFNKFDIIFVLTKGGPGETTTTVPIYAYNIGFSYAQLGRAAAISTLLFIMLVAAAIVYFYVFEPSQEVRVE